MNYSLPLTTINRGTRILLPESRDIRVLAAAIALKTIGIVEPVFIGDSHIILDTFSD